jgi:hypothetical protein
VSESDEAGAPPETRVHFCRGGGPAALMGPESRSPPSANGYIGGRSPAAASGTKTAVPRRPVETEETRWSIDADIAAPSRWPASVDVAGGQTAADSAGRCATKAALKNAVPPFFIQRILEPIVIPL